MLIKLRAAGYKVAQAKNPADAWRILRLRCEQGVPAPLCFLVDLALPEREAGFDFCKQLMRAHEVADHPFEDHPFAEIPVIIVTGTSIRDEDVERGLRLGVWDYLQKPFVSSILTLKILHAVESAEHAREGRRQCTEGLVVTDEQGRIQWWSERADALLEPYREDPADSRILPAPILQVLQQFAHSGRFGMHTLESVAGILKLRVELHQLRPGLFKCFLNLARPPLTLEQEIAAFGYALEQQGHCHLTPRQIECAYWFADGRTKSEIGQILGIAASTVNDHIDNTYESIQEHLEVGRPALAVILASVRADSVQDRYARP